MRLQEAELAACTFQPSITPYPFDIRRPIPAALRASQAPAAVPGGTPPAAQDASAPPLIGGGPTLVDLAAAPLDLASAPPSSPAPRSYSADSPAAGRPGAGQRAAGGGGAAGLDSSQDQLPFGSYVERMIYELQEQQTVQGVPAVWGLGPESTGMQGGSGGAGGAVVARGVPCGDKKKAQRS